MRNEINIYNNIDKYKIKKIFDIKNREIETINPSIEIIENETIKHSIENRNKNLIKLEPMKLIK